jgi:hypothetical protein
VPSDVVDDAGKLADDVLRRCHVQQLCFGGIEAAHRLVDARSDTDQSVAGARDCFVGAPKVLVDRHLEPAPVRERPSGSPVLDGDGPRG